jgi:tripartite-type tricarboxylate transporter receptor subunit TctC
MPAHRNFIRLLPGYLALFNADAAFCQNYPSKPVRVVTITAGSGIDFTARLIARALSSSLGQQVIVDNRGSIVSGDIVSKAPPDGYTLLVDSSSFWLAPLLQEVPYDPERSFTPISLLASSPLILVTSPAIPINSVAALIALAKTKPGVLNYASGTSGGSGHLTAELFKAMTGVNIVRVGYKGTVLSYTDLMSGRVHILFESAPAVMPLVKSGKMNGLAVTTLQPTVLAPGMPTVAEAVPGFEVLSMTSILAPAKTPAAIIDRLNQEIVRILKTADAREKLINAGTDPVGSSPENLAATIKFEMAKWGKVIKDAGIRSD